MTRTRSRKRDTDETASQLEELDTLAICTPSSTGTSSKIRTKLRGATHWAAEFDVVSVLGGEGEEGRGTGLGVYGHTGCINALNWSSDGTTLASGSDDTRVCLWKLGQEPDSTFADNADIVQRYPSLGLGLSAVVHTGHRANIFSVKFAPHTTNILFTASGDHEARVFDLNQAASEAQPFSSPNPHGSLKREWSEYAKTSGVCTRVLKCHRGRVKRIATEGDSDAVFLTCSEDGTVRQHDLRVGHVCKRDCPPPLCSYREKGMGLYSLTTSIMRPELFVVAGTSPYAYLHDRRMIPRIMMEQWGVPVSPTELTQCVRRFGPARPPLVPPPAEPPTEDEDVEELDPTNHATRAERMRRARLQRARMRSEDENHVTAAKLSNVNGRDLLLTYSGGPVCLYDIFDDPESDKQSGKPHPWDASGKKNGTRKADDSHGPESKEASGQGNATEAAHAREKLVLPEPKTLGSRLARASSSNFTASSLADTPNLALDKQEGTAGDAEPVYTVEEPVDRTAAESTAPPDATARQEAVRASLRRSPSPAAPATEATQDPPRPSRRARNFEIRVGDDGELEMAIDEGDSDGQSDEEDGHAEASAGSEVNTEGYQALLQNIAAAAQDRQEHGNGDEEEGTQPSDDEDEEDDEVDEDEDEESDSDGISSSDDPETSMPSNQRRTPFREIPLVRPSKIYKGHRNVDTVKDVNFGGMDNLVVSGSDDGNVFIYDKNTSEILGIWKGDGSVVNVMQYHPEMPIMAVSGIDNSVKILAPTTLAVPVDSSSSKSEGEPSSASATSTYTKRKFSRLDEKEEIIQKNQDPSWTSERLAMPPSILINLLNRAAAAGNEEDDDDDGEGVPGQRRRIPLSALLQLAGEGDTDQDCSIM